MTADQSTTAQRCPSPHGICAAVVQCNSTEDAQRNLQTADRLVREAAARGATLVLLPEKWPLLGRGEVMARAAQPLDGEALRWASRTAAELGIDLLAGSIVECVEDDQRRRNTSVHFGPDGRPRGIYRKLHMFDVEVDGVRYAESDHERPGEELVVSELSGGQLIGMSVCYDLRFPELYRALVAAGAQVLSVPSAFTLATTRDHWEALLRARAIENQCFVMAANQIGAHAPGRRCGGRSMIIDPWGIVLACAADGEGIALAQLDFERQREVRRRLPALSHRRPAELYASPVRRAGAGGPASPAAPISPGALASLAQREDPR
jgi:predicted amidohydrolase